MAVEPPPPPDGLTEAQARAWVLMGSGELSDAQVAADPGVQVTSRTIRNWRARWRDEHGFSGLEQRGEAVQAVAELNAASWVERRSAMALELAATVQMILNRVQELVPGIGDYVIDDGHVIVSPIGGKDIRELMIAVGIGVDKADQVSGLAVPEHGAGPLVGVTIQVPADRRQELIDAERAHAARRQRAALEVRGAPTSNGDHPES